MKIARTIGVVRRQVSDWRRRGLTVGFVPTMGALHAGHRALIRRSRRLCDRTVVSIFVNPTQFAPGEDYRSYPRTWRADLGTCRSEGADLIFAPTAATMYPQGFQTTIHVGELGEGWEGHSRPGHFDGVATVVLKLFEIVHPDVAIFGRKDFQQSVIVRRLVSDFNLPIRVVVAPTVRERDGLALSSRNVYLDHASRVDAAAIFRALVWAGRQIRGRRTDTKRLQDGMRAQIQTSGRFRVDYIGFCDPETLEPKQRLILPLVILIAAECRERGAAYGKRYIDNLIIR